jgi:hypothetical protein
MNEPTLEEAERWAHDMVAVTPWYLGRDRLAALLAELDRLRDLVAEHKRTQATGGPAPAMTRDWGNEQHVPQPESAARRDMDPPARYGASNQKRSTP